MALRGRRGFTLVELMIVVAIIGVLAALATHSVGANLRAAKTAEAKHAVGAIARAAVAAFERPRTYAKYKKTSRSHVLCRNAKPVPTKVPRGRKYQPRTRKWRDFNTGDDLRGWKCLKFQIDHPIYYRYRYRRGKPLIAKKMKGSGNGFEASAQGDLDGDGVRSSFAMVGRLFDKGTRLKLATALYIDDENE